MSSEAIAPFMESTVDTLNHATASFNTVSGFDKALALVQYLAKMLIIYKSRSNSEKNAVDLKGLVNIVKIITDSRTLFRFRGSLPLMATALSTSFDPKKSAQVTLPMKLQVASMLVYYPLEHVYWLGAHGVLPISPQQIGLASKWSCRAWLSYNLLEFVNIARKLQKVNKKEDKDEFELKNITRKERNELSIQTFSLICYTYMSLHFSLDNSPFNSTSVDVAGFMAALAAYLV